MINDFYVNANAFASITHFTCFSCCLGAFQKLLSGFCPLRGYAPPPTPLTENHFAKKPLAERGGAPPPLNGKLPKIFLKKWVKKG